MAKEHEEIRLEEQGEYAYIHIGKILIQVKREDEGVIVDAYTNKGTADVLLDTMAVWFDSCEEEDENEQTHP